MAAFTKGNIVVYRVGNGTAAANGTAVTVFLDEYTPNGQLVQSVAMPIAAMGANRALTSSNNGTTEGLLSLSADGRHLVLTGYDVAPGQASVTGTTSSAVNRVIGRVGADGTIDTSTTVTAFSGVAIRSATSLDGGQFWVTGANTGIVYQTLGGGGAGTTILSTPANNRAVGIYDGQLYVGSGSSPFVGIDRVGTGTPTTAGQTATLLTGSSATNPYQFFFADLTADVAGVDTLYVADNTGTNGLEKFSLVGGAWVLNNKITTPTGMIGLTGSVSGSTVSMYITTAGGIWSLTDTSGYNANDNGAARQIAAAGANTAFRGIAFAPSEATAGTINFATAAVTRAEGEGGAATAFTYTLVRSGSTTAAATVSYAVGPATGTTTLDGADFQGGVLPSGTVTFASGQSQVDLVVTVADDRVFEGSESFTVTLSNPSTGYDIGAGTARGTILDDDSAGAFSIARTADATEGGEATFTITRTGGTVGTVDVAYSVVTQSGATAADFPNGVAPAGTVRFVDGQTSATIAVPTFDDTLIEGNEDFVVRLDSATGGGSTNGASALGTIIDNDTAGTVSVADVTVDEGAGTATVVLTRTGGTGDVTVTYQTADGSALAGSDYTAASGTVTFTGTQGRATIVVPITDDAAVEGSETFTVTIAAGTGAPAIGRATATVSIDDNDVAPAGTFAIAPADQRVAEGSGSATRLTFTITRTDGSTGAASVTWSVVNGSTDAADFAGATGGTVAFADGDAASKTFTVDVAGDTTVENDEGFIVRLQSTTAGAIGTQRDAAVTILNDDSSFAIAPARASEGDGAVRFTVTRTGDLSLATSVRYDVSIGGGDTATAADFPSGTLPGGFINFAAGAASATIVVPIANDTAIEGDETFTVTISNPAIGTVSSPTATGTIVNDDFPALSVSDASVVEGNDGTTTLVFTVIASAPAGANGIGFTIATADGTATAGSDYVARTAAGSIAAGQTSTTFAVTVNGDLAAERPETVIVNLSNVTGAVIADGQGVGTIVNDDGAPQGPQLLYATQFDGFTAAGFAPGATGARLDSNVFRILGLSDLPAPAYGFTSPATGDFARGVIQGSADPTGGGTYSPSANPALVLQPTGSDFVEGNGAIEARIQNVSGFTATSFDVMFDWAYRNSGGRASTLQLSYSSDGVTFTAVPSSAFTTPGAADAAVAATFSTTTAAVTIGDVVVADGGYLYLRWSHLSSSGSGNRDEIGIDNLSVRAGVTDAPTLTFADVTVAEGNSGETIATLTLTRTSVTGTASIQFATADGVALAGSDYRAQAGTVTFADGEATRTIQLVVLGDARNEPNEAFFVNFTNPQGFLLPDNQARVTITNDDTGPVAIYDIQGLGHRSSYEGLTVATSGVVTSVRTTGSDRGFYLQDAAGDGDTRTSDAIFVSTGAVSPTVAVGNAITLSGTVTEFTANAVNLTVTRLTGATGIVVTEAVAALPAAVLISTEAGGYAPPTQVIDDDRLQSYDPATDGIDYYESLEGMLVTVRAPLVVSATDAIGQTYVVANQGIGATGINERFGITILPGGDNAPEKIKIFAPGGGAFNQGDVLGDVSGILTYFGSTSGTSASYEIDPSTPLTVAIDRPAPTRETSLLVGDADHLTIASFNVENADPGDGAAKFQLIATEVTQALRNPDVIGLQEIQDADGAGTGADTSGQATAQAIIDAIVAAGGPTYRYVEIAPAYGTTGGEPGGNIRNGYLYNPARVGLVDGSVRLIEDQAFTGSRRPLVATFTFNGEEVTVVDAHSTSRGGSDTLFGAIQPPAQAGDGSRTAQATAIKAYLDSVQAANPAAKLVTLGDFNGYYYETALGRLTADGKFANLYTLLPPEERYSYLFEGYLQAFDNIVVSNNLTPGASFDVVHYNAEQPESVRITDHDQPLAKLYIPRANTAPSDLAIDRAIVAENAPAGTLVGTVVGTDREGGTLTYSLVSGDGFAIDAASGRLTTTRAFDHEATPGANVTVRVTDAGGLSYDEQFTITVTDVNEAPSAPTLSGTTVAENAAAGTLVGTVAATDPERGALSYSLVSGEGFAVDAATGRLTTTRGLDFEATPSVPVVVRATDAGGLSADARFTVTVTDVNEAPLAPTLSGTTVAENAAAGTLVGTVAATDPERGALSYSLVSGEGFAVDAATGRLTTTRGFDFEATPSVPVVVRATDAGGLSTDARFTVTVTDVNEAPTRVTLSNASVVENAAGGTVVGTLSGNDPDAGDAVGYRLAGTDTRFRIEGNQLLIAAGAAIDYESERQITLSVTATDRAGLSVTTPLTIAVTDVAETFPGTSGNDVLTGDAGDNTLSGGAGDDILFGNAGNDTLDGGDGADILNGGPGIDRLTLGSGADTVRGILSDLIGDTITDFGAEDRIVIQRSDLARADIRVTGSGSSTALAFQSGQIALPAGLSGGDIMVAHQGNDSIVTFHAYLADLGEGRAVTGSAINGVTNQRYLAGDTSSSFTVNVEALSGARFNNTLGVYEIDRATGAIVDVRIVAANVKAAGTITVTGVEAGHDLGFFIVQDGARTLSSAVLNSANLSLVRQGGALVLASNGTVVANATTFVSHDAASNVDGQAHVLSGVAGDGSGAIRLGFEDLARGGRGSDEDFQDVVLTVTAVREAHPVSAAAFETHAAAGFDHAALMVEPLGHNPLDGMIG